MEKTFFREGRHSADTSKRASRSNPAVLAITVAFFAFSSMSIKAETINKSIPSQTAGKTNYVQVAGATNQNANKKVAKTRQELLSELHKSSSDLQNMEFSAFAASYDSYSKAVSTGKIKKGKFIVVDYAQKSDMNRFYIVNFDSMELIGAIKVAHGTGNGNYDQVTMTSNVVNSYATPSGLMKITAPNMRPLRGWVLTGLESRNSRALERGILIHSWSVPSSDENSFAYSQTLGCLGLNEFDAERLGFPQYAKPNDAAAKTWVGRGVYVWHSKK